jgi:dihydrofolate synthase/folylpolyglutamate synthase
LPLLGTYQRQNLATVLAVVDQLRQQGWAISPDQVQRGLLQTRWPGRLQYFEARRWLVDGSHNEQGFESLRQSLSRYLPQQVPLYWVVSLRNNRPPEALMETLAQFPRTAGIMWTEPARVPRTPASRAVKPSLYHAPQALAEQCQVSGVFAPSVEIGWAATVDEALIWLTGQTEATEGAIGIVTGSLYTVGEVLAWIREQDEDRMP